MTSKRTDTRKIFQALQATKLTDKQAGAITDLIKDHDDGVHEDFITKADLEHCVRKIFWKICRDIGVVIGIIAGIATIIAVIYTALSYNDQMSREQSKDKKPVATEQSPTT